MNADSNCILMFSGGRDSTIAAVRLSRMFDGLILVTVTSDHLVGIDRVNKRILEMRHLLPRNLKWYQIEQPELAGREVLHTTTCLPCHRAYVLVGVLMADSFGIADLSFGYTAYQRAWPEQTEHATKQLTGLLQEQMIRLHLPVYDMKTKHQAISELRRLHLSTEALEQKCVKQEFNIELEPSVLEIEIQRWSRSIIEDLKDRQKNVLRVIGNHDLSL